MIPSCIMLVDNTGHINELTEAGADEVILKGSPPTYILESIRRIAEKREIETIAKSGDDTDLLSTKIIPDA